VEDGRTTARLRHPGAVLPILDPAVRPLWRDLSTVQLGLHPGAAVVGGLDAASAALLRARSGGRDAGDPADAAEELAGRATDEAADPGTDDPAAAALRARLAELGVPTAARSRELAATRRAARAAATVRVEGAGRVGSTAAALLAAAGVGRVLVEDPEPVGPTDTTPAGPRLRDLGRPRDVACEAAIERHLERDGPRRAAATGSGRPDVVVLAPTQGPARAAARRLLHEGVPHLLAVVEGPYAVVGPFVLPGRSCCLHCTDLHRAARDPAWPRLLAQAEAARGDAPPCDLGLATVAAAQAVVQVLALVDAGAGGAGSGSTGPATVGGTLETTLPDGLTRRRTWEPHPACGCRWAS
jgi:hypothetical protein